MASWYHWRELADRWHPKCWLCKKKMDIRVSNVGICDRAECANHKRGNGPDDIARTKREIESIERSIHMEKYGVQIDEKKIAERKKDGEKTASIIDDPNTNVPIDPIKGTKPFEKEPVSEEKDK